MIRVDESDPVGEIEPSFPYRDVTVRRGVEFKDDYDIQAELGRGKFGIVYRCKEKTGGLMLAAKVVNVLKKEDRRSVQREVEIMRRLQHPRLIQLYDAIDAGKQIYVILELIDGGELFERVIDDDFVLTERSCAVFMRQVCEGIEFMHGQKILHLDLKPENILCLTKEGNRIKIIDFGLAREYDPTKKLQVLFGTPEFVAPEVVNFDQIGFGTDVWSIGVICYVLLSGLSPFMGDTDIETMANVTIAKYDFDHEAFAEISEDAKDFIRCLLVKDKEKRITASQCREHRWLARKTTGSAGSRTEKEAAELAEAERRAFIENHRRPPLVLGIADGDELDVTKDNLRLFVERWREHPDSPYTIDATSPRNSARDRDRDRDRESVSLRAHSPSPCDSLPSSSAPSERVIECAATRDRSYHAGSNLLAVPSLGLSLTERRASEGVGARDRRDPASQIALAEEIIRLSEHLRAIAMSGGTARANDEEANGMRTTSVVERPPFGRHDDDDNNDNDDDDGNVGGARATTVTRSARRDDREETNEIAEKLSSIARQRKLNGTTFHSSSRGYDRYVQDGPVGNAFLTLRRTSVGDRDAFESSRKDRKYSVERSSAFAERTSVEKKRSFDRQRTTTTTFSERTTTCQTAAASSVARFGGEAMDGDEMDLTPPWRRPRVKRSFGETSRDVPRISRLRDLHKNLNLDEPGSAKDLLLHLLGEWDEATATTPGTDVGRKSVSLDWCAGDSVARRTMNSLAEYFQSRQRQPQNPDRVASSASPSIYR